MTNWKNFHGNIAINDDCMKIMATLPDKAFELAVVDPPYRDENAPTTWMKAYSKSRKMFISGKPTKEYFEELRRVSNNQIIWGTNNFGFSFSGFVVWDKTVRGGLYSECEIASLSEGLSTLSKITIQSVYDQDRIHPTQKPVALYEWLLTHYAKQGDRILDTHLGSGSSRIAAYNLGFDFVGCEIDKDYFDAQEERFRLHTAQTRLFDTAEASPIEQTGLFDTADGAGKG